MSLKEHREIVALAQGGPGGVLVTLVRSSGSTYRRPGARLLALPDGRTAGTISGGCLEADLLKKAQWRVRDGAVMQSYDTGFDDLAEIPFGLGCGGAVELLLEPAASPDAQAVLASLRATLNGEARRMVTRLPKGGEPLARIVLDSAGDAVFASEYLPTEQIVAMRRTLLSGSRDDGDLFVEALAPAQRLVVLGAGEDAKPLTRIASELGWTVVVADGRPQQARAERFPLAQHVVVAGSARQAGVGSEDAVVLMTHSFQQDVTLLTELLKVRPRYLGLLGARHRSALLLRQASDASGIGFADALDRVHAPIGLNLGGDGPESIALAIAAEIQAVLQSSDEGAAGRWYGGERRMGLAEAERMLPRSAALMSAVPVCALELEGAALRVGDIAEDEAGDRLPGPRESAAGK